MAACTHTPARRVPPAHGFQPLVVSAASGPHLTMQAGVMHAGRYWTTTSRTALKARILRRRPRAGIVLHQGGADRETQVWSGEVTVLDPLHPLRNLADPEGSFWAGTAITRLVVAQGSAIAGYVMAAGRVPLGWLPTHRVLLSLRPTHRLVFDRDTVLQADGAWRRPAALLTPQGRPPPPVLKTGELPATLRPLAEQPTPDAYLGVLTPEGPAALPAAWEPGQARITVPMPALAVLRPSLPGQVCLTLDDSAGRRPDRKQGVMLRGRAHLLDTADGLAHLRLVTGRITYWDGFVTDTAAA